ncbi:MAG: hypothetical protein CFE25_13975 [Chitinophagaceae bacterium BSSC1]|nr:MAG: hypothetical protein CFE25_13975 [Chitinophagaceae bacterium BSSC1]
MHKTVIDFAQLTDKELYEALQQGNQGNTGKICGRFTQTQLNRAINYQALYQTTKLNKILAGLIVLGTTQAEFPNEAKANNIEIVSNKGRADYKKDKAQDKAITDSAKFIEGRIVDDKLNPIAYASVYFKDKNIGVTTNNNGQFKLMVPDTYKRKLTIQVSAAGYETKEMYFNKKQLPVKGELTMKLAEEFMGDVIIARSDD